MGKTDTTGTYSYLCDGASPGAAVLSDGHAVYTPGLSENRAGAVTYPAFDRIGNLWTQDSYPKSQTFYEDFTGFGSLTAVGGGNASPFRFGGAMGCQTDADTGLVLMGHRYFDPRTGRFITQDPAHDGHNWYAYAGNDPVNKTDPTGLWCPTPTNLSMNGGDQSDAGWATGRAGALEQAADSLIGGLYTQQADLLDAVSAAATAAGAQAKFAQGWNLALGTLGDFLAGTGSDSRTYRDGSTQVEQLLNSSDGSQMLQQMAKKKFRLNATGGINTLDAARNTALDWGVNATESQLGAFNWRIISRSKNNVGAMVWNDLSVNSFLYHTGGLNYYRAPISTPYGPVSVQEPMSTVTQYFFFHVKAH